MHIVPYRIVCNNIAVPVIQNEADYRCVYICSRVANTARIKNQCQAQYLGFLQLPQLADQYLWSHPLPGVCRWCKRVGNTSSSTKLKPMEVQINKDMTATIILYEYTNKIHNLLFFFTTNWCMYRNYPVFGPYPMTKKCALSLIFILESYYSLQYGLVRCEYQDTLTKIQTK